MKVSLVMRFSMRSHSKIEKRELEHLRNAGTASTRICSPINGCSSKPHGHIIIDSQWRVVSWDIGLMHMCIVLISLLRQVAMVSSSTHPTFPLASDHAASVHCFGSTQAVLDNGRQNTTLVSGVKFVVNTVCATMSL